MEVEDLRLSADGARDHQPMYAHALVNAHPPRNEDQTSVLIIYRP
jgi:hypothetical protein